MTLENRVEERIVVVPLNKNLTIVIDEKNKVVESHVRNKEVIKDFLKRTEKNPIKEMNMAFALKYLEVKYGENSEMYKLLAHFKENKEKSYKHTENEYRI